MWPAIIAGAATVGAGLLQGIFNQKQAEEDRAYKYQMEQERKLDEAQKAQIQAPLNYAQSNAGALNALIANWRR